MRVQMLMHLQTDGGLWVFASVAVMGPRSAVDGRRVNTYWQMQIIGEGCVRGV